jgi:hypothetical protein
LWNRAVKQHEEDKDPKALPKKGQDQKVRIKKDLTTLRLRAAGDMSKPSYVERFVKHRDKLGKLMTRYCRYLKGAKDEDKKVLPKYLKTVKRLTVLVLKLDPGNLSQEDEDASLDSLDEVDVADIDNALEAPEAAEDEDLDEDLDEELPEDMVPGEDETEAEPDDKARWEERRAKVEPRLLEALKAQRGDVSRMRAVFAFADEKAGAGDYAKALQGLDQLEKLLGAPPADEPEAKKADDDGAARFNARLKDLLPEVQKAVAAGQPNGTEAKLRVSEAGVFGRKKDFEKAHALLDQAEALLGKGGEGDEADEFEEMYKGLLETVPDDLKRLRGVNPTAAATIEKIVKGAAGHARNGDFQKAFTFLDQAAGAIAKAFGAARVSEAREAIPEGKVAEVKASFEKARVRWDAAVAAARAGMKPVEAELQTDYPKAITGLKAIMDSYWNELLETLRAGEAAQDGSALGGAVGTALTAVQTLGAEIAADPLFAFLDKEHGTQVRAEFAKAFGEVEKIIRG